MGLLLILVSYLALLGVIEANPSPARYDNFKVYRLNIKDEQQFREFKKLAEDLPLRILTEVRGPGHSSDVVIDPANQRKLETKLRFLEFEFECIIEDLQSVIEDEQGNSINAHEDVKSPAPNDFEKVPARSSFKVPQYQMNWTHYHSLSTIYKWFDKLAEEHPNLITTYIIGYSYENKPIKAMKISSKPGNKAILLECGIHAIEWISPATGSCFVQNLTNPSDKEMKLLLQKYDWLYVPVLNPDGYEYSRNVERLWRKNRKPTGFYNTSGPCFGTDLNRNFPYKWGVNAYNHDVACDHWYAGSESNTESEVVSMQNFVNSFDDDYIGFYTSLHAFGNMLLFPYGHTDQDFPSNYDDMMSIGEAFGVAAEEKYGTKFRYGASGVVNYNVSGSAKDWAYGVKNIPFTATMELRDNGKYGFFLPRNQILQVCDEVTHGIKAMVKKGQQLGYFD